MYVLSSLTQEKEKIAEGLTVRNTRDIFGYLYNNGNGVPVRAYGLSPLGVRQKIEKDSQCESFLLRSLTPARLISF